MYKLRFIVPGLLLALLIAPLAAGIAHAQCTGSSTSVDCTGIDPNGYIAPLEAPGAATSITVHDGAQVNRVILLDGDDTVTIEPGGAIAASNPSQAAGVLGVGGNNTVTNGGSITANSQVALGVGVIGPNSEASNSGTITATGTDLSLGMGAAGIEAQVSNSGTIQTSGGMLSLGMGAAGMNAEATNSGTVSASNGMINLGMGAAGMNTQATNNGTVSATDGMINLGLGVAGTNAQASNSGSVTASGGMASIGFGVAGYGVQATNSGSVNASASDVALGMAALADGVQLNNSGDITVHSESGYWASGVYAIGDGIQVNNSGTITAAGAGGFGVDIEMGSAQITNSGTITGGEAAIWGNDSSQTVVNSGTINGEVWLEGGNDAFVAAGGVVNGLIDGGADYDVLSFEMDISADSWESALAALAQANPSGGTIVLGGVTYTWTNFEELYNLVQLYAIRDRRINGLDFAATAIVYRLEEGGVELYTPPGEWVFNAEADALIAALANAAASGAPVEVDARLGLALYAMPDGSLFATGPGYAFAFQPYQCGIDL